MNATLTSLLDFISNPVGNALDGHVRDGANRRRAFNRHLSSLPADQSKALRAEFVGIQKMYNDAPVAMRTSAMLSVAVRRLEDLYTKVGI